MLSLNIPGIQMMISRLVKQCVLLTLRRLLDSAAVQDLLSETLRQPRRGHCHLSRNDIQVFMPPYRDLGHGQLVTQTSRRSDIVFITARFRSGSTLLWNLFRHLDGVTAYYEPLNERQWFNPALRGERVDTTHKLVEDYWQEYEGLEVLGQYYRQRWTSQNLLMDSSFWDSAMQRYIEILIEEATERPVLQFNRVDFRLPWLRHHFPCATIIHLYRHAREQWCSTLMDLNSVPKMASMEQFAALDKFYLGIWANDLKYHFPFLDEAAISHPYQCFYYIWKLSYLFGVKYADYSLSYESLLDEPHKQLKRLMTLLKIEVYDLEALQSLIIKPNREKWRAYADDEWFRHHEETCETVMAKFFAPNDRTTHARGAVCRSSFHAQE
jgi:Sulfotransferase family